MTSTELPKVENLSAFTKEMGFHTYISLISLAPDNCQPPCRDTSKFLNHIKAKFKGNSNQGDLRLHMVSVTLGQADAVLVWQARTAEAAKEFMETVLGGYHCQSNTMMAMWSHGQSG
jgi:hypothetical protein